MKNIFIIGAMALFVSCKQEQPPKDYAVIHGTIENPKEGLNLRLYNPETSKSTAIKVDENGQFRDTLKLELPVTFTSVYGEIFNLYLKNDMDVEINFDADKISESIVYKGNGKAENDFLKSKSKQVLNLLGKDYKIYLGLNQADFEAKTNAFVNKIYSQLEEQQAVLGADFVDAEKKKIDAFKKNMTSQHLEQLKINEELAQGKPSPDFKDYLNYDGGTTSLKDLQGSYVYIDVWATWCVPCVYEIPYLKEVEKEFHGKNIKFVSISVDRKADEKKWRDMIMEKELGGVQLLADNEISSKFMTDYYIYGIPRFILLDPNGNIVSYDAPRPSMPELKDLISSLDI
ncbi:TlpA family protein disulfide reductase [Arenibacter sp. 6A1]|uniref:TlpA family protein disulfide reductase n=1 Tax=Arenibacter sp. 6A1 TaxID=2720391 RepID=UPI0014464047|nr:TlpA disulfide reductase family protein [Arenibacter sp. 6A1]NKI26933.1 TlpA family protein disulfide reductase [Arenibacter sp. 6A1]